MVRGAIIPVGLAKTTLWPEVICSLVETGEYSNFLRLAAFAFVDVRPVKKDDGGSIGLVTSNGSSN